MSLADEARAFRTLPDAAYADVINGRKSADEAIAENLARFTVSPPATFGASVARVVDGETGRTVSECATVQDARMIAHALNAHVHEFDLLEVAG